MADETNSTDITKAPVVYRVPGMEAVEVHQVHYGAHSLGPLTMDIYYPPEPIKRNSLPAVVFVLGYSDIGFQKIFGCNLSQMESYRCWGRLTAASGMIAITYETRQPEKDIHALIQHIQNNAKSLGIDEGTLGMWSCSGNVPLALSIVMDQKLRSHFRCAALWYGLMLDLNGKTWIAEAASKWGFANPCAGRPVADLAQDVPIFIARAGHDQNPGLNESLDQFVAEMLRLNLPVTLVNHPTGPHAFDLFDDSEASRHVIKQTLLFLRSCPG